MIRLRAVGIDDETAALLLGYELPVRGNEVPQTMAHSDATASHKTQQQHGNFGDEQASSVGDLVQRVGTLAQAPPMWRIKGPKLRPYDPEQAVALPGWLQKANACSDEELRTHWCQQPRPRFLLPTARLGPVLRRMLRVPTEQHQVDTIRLVGQLATYRIPQRVPRCIRSNWTPRLQLYWDQAPRLGAFWNDQKETLEWLKAWRGEQGLELIIVDSEGIPKWQKRLGRRRHAQVLELDPKPPDNGTAILALSDLGSSANDAQARQAWARRATQAERHGAQMNALVPCLTSRCDLQLRRRYRAVEWERSRPLGGSAPHSGLTVEERRRLIDRLFVLLSPAVCVDWPLLRAMRHLLPRELADAGLELDAYLDKRAVGQCEDGFVIEYEAAKDLRQNFARLPDNVRLQVADVFKRVHAYFGLAMRCEEQLVWGNADERKQAEIQIANYVRTLRQRGIPTRTERGYAERCELRQSPSGWRSEQLAAYWAVHHAKGEGFDAALPEGLDIKDVTWALNRVPQPTHCGLWQRGQYLFMVPARDRELPQLAQAGVHLADMPMAVRQLELEWREGIRRLRVERLNVYGATTLAPFRDEARATSLIIRSDMATLELVLERPPAWSRAMTRDATGLAVQALLYPPWATRLDQDEYGLYAILDLAPGFESRLRWIPPGRFLMGSPESEAGRTQDEGPQHWVELTQGFWLADAPCTQAEWEAVMGNNPSHFKGNPQLPVEQVSWDDCQEFCKRLRERWPNLDARLPTEAEWEYACRAGTLGAYNDGSDCTEPEGADPALLKVGWFGANSGGKTQPVRNREFKRNALGLNDMHGNVLEWCADYWQDNYAAIEQQDPRGPADGSVRVIRGGCWSDQARLCRSAYRGGGPSSGRINDLGFRLVAGPVSQEAEPQLQVGQAGGASGRRLRDEGRGAQAAEGERSQQGDSSKGRKRGP